MDRKTQRKGDIGVTQAIATFTKLGYDVSIPVTESLGYDLIVDIGNELMRVQVKYCSGKEVDLRLQSCNTKTTVVKYYNNSFDWLYVLKADGNEYLIEDDLSGRRSITPNKNHLI